MVIVRFRSFPKTCLMLMSVASTILSSGVAGQLPDTQPALVGSGPNSLVDLINTQHLMERGVAHGALFFSASISPSGVPSDYEIWGMTKETEPLRDELRTQLYRARFVPAVYNHQNVFSTFNGTLTFSVIDGKPHLRTFANQELPELQKESDFIAPEPIRIPGHVYDFRTMKDPFGSWDNEDKPGVAEMLLSIDASGHLVDVRLLSVSPNNKSYGDYAVEMMHRRTFLPAYRNGKAVASITHRKFYFVPSFSRLQ